MRGSARNDSANGTELDESARLIRDNARPAGWIGTICDSPPLLASAAPLFDLCEYNGIRTSVF